MNCEVQMKREKKERKKIWEIASRALPGNRYADLDSEVLYMHCRAGVTPVRSITGVFKFLFLIINNESIRLSLMRL